MIKIRKKFQVFIIIIIIIIIMSFYSFRPDSS